MVVTVKSSKPTPKQVISVTNLDQAEPAPPGPMSVVRQRELSQSSTARTPVHIVSRDEYDEVQHEYEALGEQVEELNGRRAELQTTIGNKTKIGKRQEKDAQQFAMGDIDSKTLADRNARNRELLTEAEDCEKACSTIDEAISKLRQQRDHKQKEVVRLTERLKSQHLDTMLEELPLERIQQTIVWAKQVGRCRGDRLEDLFQVPQGGIVTKQIREDILSELGL